MPSKTMTNSMTTVRMRSSKIRVILNLADGGTKLLLNVNRKIISHDDVPVEMSESFLFLFSRPQSRKKKGRTSVEKGTNFYGNQFG